MVVAVKQIHKNRVEGASNRKLLQSEVEIMQTLSHENIVSLIDTIWEENHICLVMDYCNGKDLARYIHKNAPLPEGTIAYFGRQIASALSYLHSQRIVHRDLKPQNILVHYPPDAVLPVLRIADFGFARHLSINMADTFCGSPLYMAPEVLFSEGHDERSDLWGAGAILYQCLTTKPPFKADNIEALKKILKSNKVNRLKFPVGASAEFEELISGLLQVNPEKRMQCIQFYHHPFLAREPASPGHGAGRASPVQADADRSGIPYGDAPATPSPHNSSDSNPSFLHISAGGLPPIEGGAAAEGDGSSSSSAIGGGGTSANSFVVVDKDTVELNVLADNLEHHQKQKTLWRDPAPWRSSVPRDEIERFATAVRRHIRPANAIMFAAKRRVERVHAPQHIRARAPDMVANVEALKLLNQALRLLRAGMAQVREYLSQTSDAILYSDRGGEVVQALRTTFNKCLAEVEAKRRLLPEDELQLSCYRGIEVKNVEELLFEYATELSYVAHEREKSAELSQAEVDYSRILVVFNYLSENADGDDLEVLQEYATSTRRRLDAVTAAALIQSQRPSRERRGDVRGQRDASSGLCSHDRGVHPRQHSWTASGHEDRLPRTPPQTLPTDTGWHSSFADRPYASAESASGRSRESRQTLGSFPPRGPVQPSGETATPKRHSREMPSARLRKTNYPSPLAYGHSPSEAGQGRRSTDERFGRYDDRRGSYDSLRGSDDGPHGGYDDYGAEPTAYAPIPGRDHAVMSTASAEVDHNSNEWSLSARAEDHDPRADTPPYRYHGGYHSRQAVRGSTQAGIMVMPGCASNCPHDGDLGLTAFEVAEYAPSGQHSTDLYKGTAMRADLDHKRMTLPRDDYPQGDSPPPSMRESDGGILASRSSLHRSVAPHVSVVERGRADNPQEHGATSSPARSIEAQNIGYVDGSLRQDIAQSANTQDLPFAPLLDSRNMHRVLDNSHHSLPDVRAHGGDPLLMDSPSDPGHRQSPRDEVREATWSSGYADPCGGGPYGQDGSSPYFPEAAQKNHIEDAQQSRNANDEVEAMRRELEALRMQVQIQEGSGMRDSAGVLRHHSGDQE